MIRGEIVCKVSADVDWTGSSDGLRRRVERILKALKRNQDTYSLVERHNQFLKDLEEGVGQRGR